MGECVIIYPKQDHQLDGSVQKKVADFLNELTKDDTSPGLHIEPVKNAADPRARTGRVDQQYRALLFKLTGDVTAYVLHGVYNHDDAYDVAAKVVLTLNPINGLPGFEQAAPGKQKVVHVPAAPTPAGPAPVLGFSAEDLTVSLGIPPEVAATAVALTSPESLSDFAHTLPEWQGLALLLLAAGEKFSTIAEELQLFREDHSTLSGQDAAAGFEAPVPADDQALLDGFDRPAAQMGYAKISGSEELQRVIAGGDFSAWRVFLHPQQRRWVNADWNGPYRIGGGAGTGKTVVVVHRARRLAVKSPDAPLLVTTFTTNLADELRAGLRRLDQTVTLTDKPGAPGILVRCIDSVASAVLKAAGPGVVDAVAAVLGVGRADVHGRTGAHVWKTALDVAGAGLDEPLRRVAFVQAEYELVVLPNAIVSEAQYLKVARPGRGVRLARAARKAVWAVIEAYRGAARQDGTVDFAEAATIAARHLELTGQHPFRHVLVDEGQDFKPCHWQLVRALVAEQPNDIFIAEDPHQRIYGSRLRLSQYGISTRGRSRALRLNYRTTAQNLAFAVAVLDGQTFIDSDGEPDSVQGYLSARTGPAPRVEALGSLTAQLERAAELVAGWVAAGECPPEAIGVLVRDRATRDRVVAALSGRGVVVRALDAGAVRPGAPVVLTMHRAKGTEFAKVLLFDVSAGSVPMGLGEYDFDEADYADALLRERSLLYVAASRARDELVVTFSGAPSTLMPHV